MYYVCIELVVFNIITIIKVGTSVVRTAQGTEVGDPRGKDRRERNLHIEKG
jgi:hypothetical protein